jgi:hypothetical protein
MRNSLIATVIVSSAFLFGSASRADEVQKIGSWKYLITNDKMTDVNRYAAALLGTNGVILAIKCDSPGSGSAYVGFYSTTFLGRTIDGPRSTNYRFDKDAAVTDRWYYTDTAVHINNSSPTAAAFITRMRSAKHLVIELTTFEYQVIESEFDFDKNAAVAIDRTLKDCQN